MSDDDYFEGQYRFEVVRDLYLGTTDLELGDYLEYADLTICKTGSTLWMIDRQGIEADITEELAEKMREHNVIPFEIGRCFRPVAFPRVFGLFIFIEKHVGESHRLTREEIIELVGVRP